MSSRVSISSGKRGISIRATGSAAQALFDAMTAPAPTPAPAARVDCGECPNVTAGCAAGQCSKAPAEPKDERIQIGPLDV